MMDKAFIIAFIVFGLHYIIYTPGMILHFIADWAARVKMYEDEEKMLFSCPICMSPWYGSLIYGFVWGQSFKECVAVVLAAMGINAVIVFFWDRIAVK